MGVFCWRVLVILAWPLLVLGAGDKKEIHIIGLYPMSGGWPAGEVALAATEMALEHVNARTDILMDYQLVVHPNDTECETGKGIDAVYSQIYRPPVKTMILGGGCSIVCEPVAKSSKLWNILQLSWGCSSPALSAVEEYNRFFRTISPDLLLNGARIGMMEEFKWHKVAAITQAYALFTTVIGDFAKRMSNHDIVLITSELFIEDPALQVQNIKKHDARIIMLGSYENMAAQVMCQAYKNGLYGDKYVWIYLGWYGLGWYDQYDTDCTKEEIRMAVEGMFYTDHIYGNLIEEKGIAGVTRAECEALLYKFIGDRKMTMFPNWHSAYDAVWAIALSLNSSIAKLDKIGKTIEDFSYTDAQMADIFQESLNQTRFLGVGGPFIFDANGDPIMKTGISQNKGGVRKLVGIYDNIEQTMTWVAPIEWNGETVPKDSTIYRVELLFVSQPVYIIMCCFSSLGIVIAFLLLIFNITYRNYRLIKMSSPVMNNIILVGCIVTYLTVYSQELFESDTELFCKIRSLTVMIGFSLSVGALFAKTWRVYVIFTNKTRRVILKDYKLVLIVFVIVMLDVIIFVTRELVSPPIVTREVALKETYEDGDLVVQWEILVCKSAYDLYFQGVIYCYKGLILIFGAFLAWQTRKVNIPALNDSQYIGMCIYNVAVLSILSAILIFVLEHKLELQYVLTSAFLIFGTTTVQLIIFIPKVMKLRDMKNQVEEESETATTTTDLPNNTLTAEEDEEIKKLKKENEELKTELAKHKADASKNAA